jgi:hypothetical protein
VKINGRKASEYAFKPSAALITYSMAYEEEQARLFAGISIPEWDAMPGSQVWIDPDIGGRCKAEIIMLYRMNNWIPAASQDVTARQIERESKRKHR